jgi:hypothetical protein
MPAHRVVQARRDAAAKEAAHILAHPQLVRPTVGVWNQHGEHGCWNGINLTTFQLRIVRAIEKSRRPINQGALIKKVYPFFDPVADNKHNLRVAIAKLRRMGVPIRTAPFPPGGYYLEKEVPS